MIVVQVTFWLFAFIVVWGMVGYKCILKLLKRFFRDKKPQRDLLYRPTVSVLIVAHNEEKVIGSKLENVINNDYHVDKIEYVVASDNSTDATDEIVNHFISTHPERRISLHCTKEHKGKTNAQNEAQKMTTGEILVMTDANAIFERNTVSELVSSFVSADIVYVSGRLNYINGDSNSTASVESYYWEDDLYQREIESSIKTITAGNGAIYACRNSEYIDFKPMSCHDSIMPYSYGMLGKRCVYNPHAVAYEKAGESHEDEFRRKIRMNRDILTFIKYGLAALNPVGHGWFSFFYFGHRTCRYLLWLAHIVVLLTAFILSFKSVFFFIVFLGQCSFYVSAIIDLKWRLSNRILNLISYYTMTICAQTIGAFRQATGKSKPIWSKAESTR